MANQEVTFLDGRIRLIEGDCREVLPTLGHVDALVTDPPYGIGEAGKNFASRGKLASADKYERSDWDDHPAFDAVADAMLATEYHIIFGGNYYPLSPTSCWLVWDKMGPANDFADCELAWTNLSKAVRRIRFLWNGFMRKERGIARVHPTQKPVGVMEWCINHLPADAETVLDPFMGSGTTGVACVKLGRRFIGIEIERRYFDIACERIDEASRQKDLFIDITPEPVKQDDLPYLTPAETADDSRKCYDLAIETCREQGLKPWASDYESGDTET